MQLKECYYSIIIFSPKRWSVTPVLTQEAKGSKRKKKHVGGDIQGRTGRDSLIMKLQRNGRQIIVDASCPKPAWPSFLTWVRFEIRIPVSPLP
jgi:hypothetical protein